MAEPKQTKTNDKKPKQTRVIYYTPDDVLASLKKTNPDRFPFASEALTDIKRDSGMIAIVMTEE